MKLFILNKNDFDSAMNLHEELSKQVHQRAFVQLQYCLATNNAVPLKIESELNVDAVAVFDFKSVSKDKEVFYYEFKGIAL